MTRPSWQDFGTHDESAVPELWDGVVGAWAPCLGPTGSRLHDMSRRANWGTLTNMDNATDWVIDGGQYALDFDGSNDFVAIPRPNSIAGSQSQYTMTAWVKFASGYAKLIDTGDFPNGLVVYVAVSNLNGGIQIGTGGTYPIFSTQRPIANVWFCVAVTVKNLNVALFLNGIQGASSTCASNPSFTSANWFFGGSGGAETLLGQADDLMFWNRALSAGEIRQLYQLGRGGMYQRRRRRVIYLPQAGFQAAWARGSNVMLGFNQP